MNYSLIANSWQIRFEKFPQKINKRKYEHKLIKLINDNYIILITANPYETSYDSLKHIDVNIYWILTNHTGTLKRDILHWIKYWFEIEVLQTRGDNPKKYLTIEFNEKTREMYAEFGIEARPKGDFI